MLQNSTHGFANFVCISDLKSQPLCDLVAICNCDFLRCCLAFQRLWDLRFEIAAICDCDCTQTKVTQLPCACLRVAFDFLNEGVLDLG